MPNRLVNETSPYLLQHAHNPVDWYPWGPEALERAAAEDRPIFLSVGYSACHWCHVMERESFENPEIAALMNEGFVCVKVDREERPDIDSIYMAAVQAMTSHGGWPMTVFLTPDGKPFYGGTYFPPEDRRGMAGLPRVLQAVGDAYRDNKGQVIATTESLLQQMRRQSVGERGIEPLTTDVIAQAYAALLPQFDDKYGGLGLQPKFPQPMTFEFLLRYHLRHDDPHALAMVELTLERMAEGGIYDQLRGGFHRYSTDILWLVPHFEKMLYDNALLNRLYLHAYQVTRKPLYRRVVEETLDYVFAEMTSPEGGFYSAQDADSEGQEGKFFVWRPEEVAEALDEADVELFSEYYGVTNDGNFEGRSILSVVGTTAELAGRYGITEDEADVRLANARETLLRTRSRRVSPERDDKVLTAWNGLMIAAFAEAGAVTRNRAYVAAAERCAAFVLDNMRADGRLLRTYREGRARLNAYLEDYAFLISGLLSLHEATLDARWMSEAIDLGQSMVDLFWDEASGQFYDTGRDHEELVVRPRDVTDTAIPSGSSMAVDVLLRLAVVTGDQAFERTAATALRSMREIMSRFPSAAGHWLCALDFYLSEAKEIAIVGEVASGATADLSAEIYRNYLPNRVVVGRDEGEHTLDHLPLLEAREMVRGRPTAYVCQNYVCQLPVNDPDELASQLLA